MKLACLLTLVCSLTTVLQGVLIAVSLVAASHISKSKIEKTAAAVVVRIGLLAGSIGDVQSACDPSAFDVCFHKSSGSWSSSDGYAAMDIEFKGQFGEQ